MKIIKSWDEMPPVVWVDPGPGEAISVRLLEKKYRDMKTVALALRDYIDAIPKDIQFKVAMPGIGRDFVDSVLKD